jgi:imidazole glycerol-phosphate synthase subunit HisH
MKSKIAIIDYGLGNVSSVKNMIYKAGGLAEIVSDSKKLVDYEILILPGIGSYDNAVIKLKKYQWWEAIINFKNSNKIILGICLGMQLLMEKSEEGKLGGFGFIKGCVKKFSFKNSEFRVPHMGWNYIQSENSLFSGFDHNKFYFTHSFYADPKSSKNILSKTHYGFEFTSSVIGDNVVGVQFHPEKSHNYGLAFFKNFIKIYA